MTRVIIVAEDDPLIQKLISRMIKRAGFDGLVEVFNDAYSTFEFIESTDDQIVLALLDTNLHQDGDAAFARDLRQQVPDIKIVASSGHAQDELMRPQHFDNEPLDGFLSKPFGLRDVNSLLKELGLVSPSD